MRRAYTSERLVVDLRRQNRRTPMKVLVNKTFNFVEGIWKEYIQWRVDDLRLGLHVTCVRNTIPTMHVHTYTIDMN